MPSAKCSGCARFLSPNEAARCSKCNALYHRSCASLPPKGGKTTVWQCTECVKVSARPSNVNTPATQTLHRPHTDENSSDEFLDTTPPKSVGGSSSEFTAISEEIRMFKEELRSELRSMREEFKAFREECAQLRNIVNSCNERIDGIDARLCALEQSNMSQKSERQADIDMVVAELKIELNERDQEILAADLEISNIPETKGENLAHLLSGIAVKLGVSMENRDIISVDRIGGKHINASSSDGAKEVRPRPIIVRLARRDMRDELLRAARVRRGATTADLGVSGPPTRFYINERLTKANRMLFRRAREAGNRLGWQFVWTRRGRILARKKNGDSVCSIRTEKDLHRVFGPLPQE